MPAARRSPRSISAPRWSRAHVPGHTGRLAGFPARYARSSSARAGGIGCTRVLRLFLGRAARVTVGVSASRSNDYLFHCQSWSTLLGDQGEPGIQGFVGETWAVAREPVARTTDPENVLNYPDHHSQAVARLALAFRILRLLY